MPAERTSWRVGVSYRESFLYETSSGTFVSGKHQADFTIRLTKDGVAQSAPVSPAFTIAEIGSTGEYAILSDASNSGFVNATGTYVLTIYDTSAPQYTWAQTICVTADGTFSGTSASFTATTGNGRVTDTLGNPLGGATVNVRVGTTQIASFTTASDGTWGPVYLSTTSLFDVQKGAYVSSVGNTITVVGTVATGPGADIQLSIYSNSASIINGDVQNYTRRQMTDNVGAKANAQIQESIWEAMDTLAKDLGTPYYQKEGSIRLYAPQSGQVSITQNSATVTLVSGSWPSWANSGDGIMLINGQSYRVLGTSGSAATLEIALSDATNATQAYTLYLNEYSLPADILTAGPIIYTYNWVYGPTRISFEQLIQLRSMNSGSQRGIGWAIKNAKLCLWPYPSQDTVIKFLYIYRPPRLLYTDSATALDLAAENLDLLHRAIDVALFRRGLFSGDGDTLKSYDDALAKAKANNRLPMTPAHPMAFGMVKSPRHPIVLPSPTP